MLCRSWVLLPNLINNFIWIPVFQLCLCLEAVDAAILRGWKHHSFILGMRKIYIHQNLISVRVCSTAILL